LQNLDCTYMHPCQGKPDLVKMEDVLRFAERVGVRHEEATRATDEQTTINQRHHHSATAAIVFNFSCIIG
jgi:hypothetical protein